MVIYIKKYLCIITETSIVISYLTLLTVYISFHQFCYVLSNVGDLIGTRGAPTNSKYGDEGGEAP